jgi:hypothetical protein
MRLVALLEYIPETSSLASSHWLYAGWLSLRLLARALCTVTPLSPLG